MREKLRVGLLFDSEKAPAWIHKAVENLLKTGCIEIAFVIVLPRPSSMDEPDIKGISGEHPPFLYRLFQRIDSRLFRRGSEADSILSLSPVLSSFKKIVVEARIKNGTISFGSNDLTQIRESRIDIILLFSTIRFDTPIFTIPKFGAWFFQFGRRKQFGDCLIGYEEVFEHKPYTEARLVASNGSHEAILCHFKVSTHKLSPWRARNAIFWYASSMIARQVTRLYRSGEGETLGKVLEARELRNDPEVISDMTVTNRMIIANLFQYVAEIIREFSLRIIYRDAWHLLYKFDDKLTFDSNNSIPIKPPSDRFWADPFIVRENGRTLVFVEEFRFKDRKGQISVIDLDSIQKQKKTVSTLVIQQPYHLSYPFVFQYNGSFYMIPESSANQSVDLYECVGFPDQWKYKMTLLDKIKALDPTLLFYNGKWWLFAGIREHEAMFPDVELCIYYSKNLFSTEWTPHPLNPVVSDVSRSRPAGKIFERDGKLMRPSQESTQHYGHHILINEIVRLSENEYEEVERLAIVPDGIPNIRAAHTLNYSDGIWVTDGLTRQLRISI